VPNRVVVAPTARAAARGTTTTHTQGPQERGVVEAQRKASREGGSTSTSAADGGQTVPTGASGWDRGGQGGRADACSRPAVV